MDTEHTPLPWYADYQIVRAEDTSVIALCKNTDEIGGREANAALIVHSVNLHDALVEGLREADRPIIGLANRTAAEVEDIMRGRIRALLAKATS